MKTKTVTFYCFEDTSDVTHGSFAAAGPNGMLRWERTCKVFSNELGWSTMTLEICDIPISKYGWKFEYNTGKVGIEDIEPMTRNEARLAKIKSMAGEAKWQE